MPNWCSNQIIITGEREMLSNLNDDIQKYIQQPQDENNPHVGLLTKLIGLPEGTSELDDSNWYSVNSSWLGTKWDVFKGDVYQEVSESEILLSFDTAWSPPINFCRQLSKKYGVNVQIDYSEEGNDFKGLATFNSDGGEDIQEYEYWEGLYKLDIDYFNELIDMELEDLVDDLKSINDDEITDDDIKETLDFRFPFLTEEDAKFYTNKIKEII